MEKNLRNVNFSCKLIPDEAGWSSFVKQLRNYSRSIFYHICVYHRVLRSVFSNISRTRFIFYGICGASSVTTHAGCTKSGTPKLAKTQKTPKSQLFELSLKPLEGFKNGKIISWSKLDTQDHVPEVLSWYKFFWMILWCSKQGHIFGVPLFVQPACYLGPVRLQIFLSANY